MLLVPHPDPLDQLLHLLPTAKSTATNTHSSGRLGNTGSAMEAAIPGDTLEFRRPRPCLGVAQWPLTRRYKNLVPLSLGGTNSLVPFILQSSCEIMWKLIPASTGLAQLLPLLPSLSSLFHCATCSWILVSGLLPRTSLTCKALLTCLHFFVSHLVVVPMNKQVYIFLHLSGMWMNLWLTPLYS